MAKRPVNNKNKKVIGNRKPQGNFKKNVGLGVKKRSPLKPKVQDARNKLIQKKRSNVVDARDVLAQMAKKQDARNKLNKLRQKRVGPQTPGNVKVIGSNILQKTDRNGKISLVTNKAKATPSMGYAIQKELGLISPPTATSPKKIALKRPPLNPARGPQTLRQAVFNEIDYATRSAAFNPGTSPLYKWTRPRPPASQLISSLETRNRVANQDPYHNWTTHEINPNLRVPHGYVDLDAVDDEEMPLVSPSSLMKHTISLQGSSRVSNIHMRLDNNPIEPESHGILAQTKTKVVVPAGHRILVSNLQETVTEDDVKELFEDIGQLLTARLIRKGVAEVIYKNLKDAQKAVETYHNRQLDGQPMKCFLINKRPLNNPTAPAINKMDTHGILGASDSSAANSNKLVPDLSTIHKVLFQRK